MPAPAWIVITATIAFSASVLASPAHYCNTCPRDERGRIQRSPQAKSEFRRSHPCPATGNRRGACPDHVIDHVVPLCAGGADTPENMQWQTVAEAKAKDREELRQCGNRHQ